MSDQIPAPSDVEHAEWHLEGVSCADCARKASEEIKTLPGVEEADIRVMSSRLVVTYRPSDLSLEAVQKALATEGMRLTEDALTAGTGDRGQSGMPAPHSILAGRRGRLTLSAGILFGAGLLLSAAIAEPLLIVVGWWSVRPSDILLLAASFIGGLNFYPTGMRALVRLRLDMHVLMSVAITGAVVLGEFVEAASIAFLFSLAELLEEVSVDRARRSLRELMSLAPVRALLIRNGGTVEVDSRDVEPGQRVAVRAGAHSRGRTDRGRIGQCG